MTHEIQSSQHTSHTKLVTVATLFTTTPTMLEHLETFSEHIIYGHTKNKNYLKIIYNSNVFFCK